MTKLVDPVEHFPESARNTAYLRESALAHLTLGSSEGHRMQRKIQEIHIPPLEYVLPEGDPLDPCLTLAGGVWRLLMGTSGDPGALRAYMEAHEYMGEEEKESYHTLVTQARLLVALGAYRMAETAFGRAQQSMEASAGFDLAERPPSLTDSITESLPCTDSPTTEGVFVDTPPVVAGTFCDSPGAGHIAVEMETGGDSQSQRWAGAPL